MKVGVVLSGCGYLDGAEIREAVLTLLALDRAGARVQMMAPDRDVETINHVNQRPQPEKRNILIEAARIARGEIVDIKSVNSADLDALILPGGYGAAKHLSDFAVSGCRASVDPAVEQLIGDVHREGKPIGAICISPAILARMFGKDGVQLTIGNDEGTAKEIEKCGARHRERAADDIEVDERLRVVTTPAYMYGQERIGRIADGIEKLVRRVLGMAKATRM